MAAPYERKGRAQSVRPRGISIGLTRNYGFSGLPCSGLPCSGLLLECGALSCPELPRDGLECCCAGAWSTCGLPRASPCGPLDCEAFGTGRISLAGRALLEGPEFGLEAATSRFMAFVGRSFRPAFRLS